MNRHQFTTNRHVVDFVTWLVPLLTALPVTLAIPHHRRFVPGGVHGAFVGIDAVTAAYQWRSTGMATGDWGATCLRTSQLSHNLRAAVTAGNPGAAFAAAWAVIEWGGGNRSVGAYPFLLSLGANLIPYLLHTQADFDLAAADEAAIAPPVAQMNSMLTKVHAFLATDGLPIYRITCVAFAAQERGGLPGQVGTKHSANRQYPKTSSPGTIHVLHKIGGRGQ